MPSERTVEDRVLDAARACVEAFGVRRTTLADVARRAGVSRPTVYRHWPDAGALVADLLTRELRALLDGAAPDPGTGTARDRLARRTADGVTALLGHPLFTRVVDTEPELLATYAFHRLGAVQRAALDAIRPEIAAGQVDGSVRPGDPDALARMVLVAAQAAATSRRLTEDVLPGPALAAELRHLVAAYLAPAGA
ncbi:TetR/AcrR family transcriptional regulator [Nocardiopsis trehalosi]|uniref:TetR/AcrR family transcriptional regulator n=1 Tax=Nocardiopsis trehalosi TaxID=109329 RepID=UPI00082ED027|nr:TetR/AcrR family transcriptional regulator [Nocardiopsis trehalosi]